MIKIRAVRVSMLALLVAGVYCLGWMSCGIFERSKNERYEAKHAEVSELIESKDVSQFLKRIGISIDHTYCRTFLERTDDGPRLVVEVKMRSGLVSDNVTDEIQKVAMSHFGFMPDMVVVRDL